MEKLRIQTETVMDLMQIKNNYMTQNLVLIIIIGLLISCKNPNVFEEYESFENQQWNTDSLLSFDYIVRDTISAHRLTLKVRHCVEYEYQNLILFVSSDFSRDTVELLLADKKGKWIGRGIGNIRETEIILEKGKIFSKKEKKTIKIEQAMRYGSAEKITRLKFIDAIGISIVKEE